MQKSRKPDVMRCSFCNKAQDDVRKLIAGPAVFICGECVEICVDILASETTLDAEAGYLEESQRLRLKAAAVFPKESTACSLCGKSGFPEDMLPIASRGILCGACADAVEDAMRQGRPIT